MLKRAIVFGMTALFSATAFAAAGTDQSDFQQLSVQGGQGAPLTVVIPTAPAQAPYALTGNAQAPRPEFVQMQLGQGSPIWVPR